MLLAAVLRADGAAIDLAAIFGDGMVLQRDRPIRIWGRAPAGAGLTVSLAGKSATTRADERGAWEAELPALPAGGPHALSVARDGETIRTLHDVLIGDVWLCSGQSNMEWPVSSASGDFELSRQETIRLATIAHASAVTPRTEHDPKPRWRTATAESIAGFSAVCWFFGEEVQAVEAIPLGLINASWGGSQIEAWMSVAALREVGGFDPQLDALATYAQDPAAGAQWFGESWERAWQAHAGSDDAPWRTDPHDPGWRAAPARMMDWNDFGDPELAGHNGMVWFRNAFDLTPEQAGQDATLFLGGIDEVDVTWVNGRFVGSQFGWGTERVYRVPADVLEAGANTLVVNVLSTWDQGGMIGPSERVVLAFDAAAPVPLGNGWEYRRVPADHPMPPRAPWESIGGLTGLHNAMIAPLEGLRLAGVLWYQGESNADRAEEYQDLLRALTADWRGLFGDGLPFIIVQLPGFGDLLRAPRESGWAAIRDAQRRVAVAEPETGLVVTLDAGDRTDLHPPNKRIVGKRAAEVARALTYGGAGTVDGITPRSAYRAEGAVIVEFAPDAGVWVSGAASAVSFELCGDGPGTCEYAEARLEGHRVVLTADGQVPSRVRFCWADAPICNLYGRSGLPVGSFEVSITD